MSDSWPRRRLLAILRGASEPLDAQELARVTGQHVTTVRFHLDVLTRESLVRQFQQPPRGRGRPRIGYSAVQRSIGYLELSQVLADQLGPDSRRRTAAAVAAGRAWGSRLHLREQRRVGSLAEAMDLVMSMLSELGFAPERDPVASTEDRGLLELHACPLRELARTHAELVRGVYAGLIQEIVDRSGGRGTVRVRVHSFTDPESGVVRLELLCATASEAGTPAPDIAADMAAALSVSRESAEPLVTPSAGRVAPQLRNTDAHVGKQSAQQW